MLGSIFLEKARLKSDKNLRFFKTQFCSRSSLIGPISSENIIIELSFEIEVIFFEETNFLLWSIFQKREGDRLRKIVDFLQKKFFLERAWSICSEDSITQF